MNRFCEVIKDDLPQSSCHQKKYYIVLTKEHDWDVDELIVVENFHLHLLLMYLATELNARVLVNSMCPRIYPGH